MSAKTRREYMKFALPGKPLESSLDQGDQRAGKAVSATALGQLDRGPDLDFVNDLSQFRVAGILALRSEEHTSELQSLMRISYAVFCLKKKRSAYKKSITIDYEAPYGTQTTYELKLNH